MWKYVVFRPQNHTSYWGACQMDWFVVKDRPMSNSTQSGQGAISNILAVAGFIILIAIIIWGAYHFLELASSGLSSLFGRNSDAIKVTLSDNTVASGEAFDASWTYTPEGAGVYTVLYQCTEGLQLRSVTGNGIVTAIPCGAAFPLGNETTKTARIIPSVSGDKTIDTTVTFIFNPAVDSTSTSTATAPRPQGSAKVAIAPAATAGTGTAQNGTGTNGTGTGSGTGTKTGTATKPAATTPAKPVVTTPKPTVTGTPDLEVRILAVGVIDPYTGSFIARAPMGNEMAAVKFDVVNRGSAATGAWYFSAELPTYPTAPYNSPRQASLAPGDHIENTLRFNQVTPGGGLFAVTVDSSNAVRETNESNNTTGIWVGATGAYPYAY